MSNPKLIIKPKKTRGANVEPGTYNAAVVSVEFLGMAQWDKSLPAREMVQFNFNAYHAGPEGHDEQISYGCAMSLGTARGKDSNLTKIFRATCGSVPTTDFNLEDLIGKQCRIVVDIVPDRQGRHWSKIVGFLPPAQPKQQPQQQTGLRETFSVAAEVSQ
jgi:hypothetical protein